MVHVFSDPRLEESYRTCRRMQRRHDPTYYLATRVPAARRAARRPRPVRLRARRGPDRRRARPRRPAGAPRRAALDALAGRARARAGGRALRPPGRSPRWSTPAAATGCRCTCSSRYMDSMRVDCDEPVRIALARAARRLHGGQRRRRSGASWPRCSACRRAPRRRAARRRLPADELHPRRADRLGPGPRLPARAARGRPARRRRERLGPRARAPQEVARARGLFADTAGVALALAPADAPRRRASRARSTRRVLDRVERNGYDVLGAPLAPRVAARWEAARARRCGR